ncbi:hypothetical protein GpartN1_g4434.t1 [Galdieria partita]|uniref:Uncharacterized protein n=1 Tax=Galdieria partita TaxID=83374 RepID=A0A9C7PXC0_9RHOD|nr:hypothetical protein GpartN1_g4434.t1 [Galdieria partita]
MSSSKQWLLQRKSLLEAFQRVSDKHTASYWQSRWNSYIEEQLKEEDNEKTLVIYRELVQLCQSPQNFSTGLQLLDKWLPCSRLLQQSIFEPLEPCLIQLVESDTTQVCQLLSRWDEYYGAQFPSLHRYVRRFVKKNRETITRNEATCTNATTFGDSYGMKEDFLEIMKQLRECLGLIVPMVEEDERREIVSQGNPSWTSSEEPKDITIQLVTDISLLENEENSVLFESCRELLGQLEKIYSRAKQVDRHREDWINEVESLLQHCYHLGLRSNQMRSSCCSYDRTSEDSKDDILWVTVDDQQTMEQDKLLERSHSCSHHDQWKQPIEKQESTACNEDILQQLETTMPYPSERKRRDLYSNETPLQQKPTRVRTKKKESSKHRIAKQLKQTASKVSKTWNQMQEREDLERYHQTFANSVTVGRID